MSLGILVEASLYCVRGYHSALGISISLLDITTKNAPSVYGTDPESAYVKSRGHDWLDVSGGSRKKNVRRGADLGLAMIRASHAKVSGIYTYSFSDSSPAESAETAPRRCCAPPV